MFGIAWKWEKSNLKNLCVANCPLSDCVQCTPNLITLINSILYSTYYIHYTNSTQTKYIFHSHLPRNFINCCLYIIFLVVFCLHCRLVVLFSVFKNTLWIPTWLMWLSSFFEVPLTIFLGVVCSSHIYLVVYIVYYSYVLTQILARLNAFSNMFYPIAVVKIIPDCLRLFIVIFDLLRHEANSRN